MEQSKIIDTLETYHMSGHLPKMNDGHPHATAPPPPATTAPILNPKIDSGVPLRRAPLPAAAGSSFTPASPPLGNRLTQKSIQSTEV